MVVRFNRWEKIRKLAKIALITSSIKKTVKTLHFFMAVLSAHCLQWSAKAAEDFPKPVKQILDQFDQALAVPVSKAADRVRPILENEIRRRTQKGDLDGALAMKQASMDFEERVKVLSAPTAPAVSPVGKWHRPDGRVYVIEPGGKGIIVRGNEGAEPITWEAVGAKFRINFPTLTNVTNYIWPEDDGSWSFSWEDPNTKIGSLRRVD
jgi:hypothetical protein